MSLFDKPSWSGNPMPQNDPVPGAYSLTRAGAKMRKRAEKHRLDHSNPGGTVSMYFREKRARV